VRTGDLPEYIKDTLEACITRDADMRPWWEIALLETCEQHQVLDMHVVQSEAVEPFLELEHLRPVFLGNTLPGFLAIADVADRSDGVLEPDSGRAVGFNLDDQGEVPDLG